MPRRIFTEPPVLGRRIAVWGATGSGKTTLTRKLGRLLNLRFIELDDLFWLPDWQQESREHFPVKVQDALASTPDGWVCDGNYKGRLGDLVISQADSVIWLHLPLRVSFWRVLKRTIVRAWTRETMWTSQNRESWRLTFLSKDSLLWWSISNHHRTTRGARDGVAALPERTKTYELRSAAEVAAFLNAVETHASQASLGPDPNTRRL